MKFIKPVSFVILLISVVFQAQAQDNIYNLNETYSINEKGTVHLESDDAEVTIEGTDRSDVHLVVYHKVKVDGWEMKSGEGFKMEVDNRGGDLYIREAEIDDQRFMVGNIEREYRITIEAPREVALDITGDDGTCEISGIDSGIKLLADDSEISLNDLNGDNFDFRLDDSQVQMDEGRGMLSLRLDDSEFQVRRGDFSEVDATFDDSEVIVTTSLSDNGSYRFRMDDSKLGMNITGGGGEFNIQHDDPDISVGDNFEQISSGEDRSAYRLPGGNARIEIKSEDSRIELRTM